MNTIGRLLCKVLGHHFDPIELGVLRIKSLALNAGMLNREIRCRWCKRVFITVTKSNNESYRDTSWEAT